MIRNGFSGDNQPVSSSGAALQEAIPVDNLWIPLCMNHELFLRKCSVETCQELVPWLYRTYSTLQHLFQNVVVTIDFIIFFP